MIVIILLFLASHLNAATPTRNTYKDESDIFAEVRNIYDLLQDQQFRVVDSTPLPNDSSIKDGEIVRYSSGTVRKLMWRDGVDIYAVQGSCITVRR